MVRLYIGGKNVHKMCNFAENYIKKMCNFAENYIKKMCNYHDNSLLLAAMDDEAGEDLRKNQHLFR